MCVKIFFRLSYCSVLISLRPGKVHPSALLAVYITNKPHEIQLMSKVEVYCTVILYFCFPPI